MARLEEEEAQAPFLAPNRNDPLEPSTAGHPAIGKPTRYARWRRTLGLTMLSGVVLLWTASNFLGSAVLADETYNKPFLLTYYNTMFFILPLIPTLVVRGCRRPEELREWKLEAREWIVGWLRTMRQRRSAAQSQTASSTLSSPLMSSSHHSLSSSRELLLGQPTIPLPSLKDPENTIPSAEPAPLTIFQTALLGFEFCLLWFFANYWIAVSLEYTTVASSTILTSTSSVFTLVFGVLFRVETFTWRKLIGIIASLAGIVIISSVDLSGTSSDDEHRGDFPVKSVGELVLGNSLAFLSALTYGVYTVLMKKRIDDESRISMPLFFGFVGLINVLLLWPGFFVLHWTGIETFEFPPNGQVWTLITTNSVASLVADMCWGYAVLLTTPLVVTVGLSLTIPLSLIGQVVLNSQTASALYWIGAVVVVASFVFVNHEEKKEEELLPPARHDVVGEERLLGAI